MKFSYLVPFLPAASAAATGVNTVNYDGYKVYRLAVGDKVSQVNDLINSLSLSTWKGSPKAGATSDIVVPPSQVQAFEQGTADFDTQVMHDNLGASIQDESKFEVYAGNDDNGCLRIR